mmetsp:Transcript_18335/g.51097  ORF Transcript_18335/g.51097 Transcript_18335/m.51097 type:complete len:284 (+) Transcript_18335:113-964(+)|eukprot:CAMPEP_0172374918 /NCGR_PEP_ID=MMETSP1060-20121228/58297_1 /TAXON_ID=37318 /ORGANISM="Pseudo-nitzschia pungens, Strain cf. cingulata" /LENGTH=283 /DNA_ID=CAMNT_0013101793 /DNA_START=97 /DNA_END=948 /DNA_ORIENTATION=+
MFHTGTIVKRFRISPTVMMLDIRVAPSLTTFSPGQWVDVLAKQADEDWVGGFSIASSPRDLPTITLAVKRSDHPPAAWVHDDVRSAVGVPVEVKVGGSCVLDDHLPLRPSVFCAGGIGISPILSQYREFLFRRDAMTAASTGRIEANCTTNTRTTPGTPSTMFLYSASSAKELVFGKELAELSKEGCSKGHDRMVFSLTNGETIDDGNPQNRSSETTLQEESCPFPAHVERRKGRILTDFLDEGPIDANYYICGPSSMIDDAVSHLKDVRSIPSERIKYEKWW